MNKIAEKLLRIISDYADGFKGAFNIREDGQCVGRQSTPNIRIDNRVGGI